MHVENCTRVSGLALAGIDDYLAENLEFMAIFPVDYFTDALTGKMDPAGSCQADGPEK
jgi:hypothetical protein